MEEMNSEELIKIYVDELRTSGKSPETRRIYPSVMRQFCRFMNGKNLQTVSKDDLKKYLDTMREREFKETSVRRHFTILSGFYSCLVFNEIMSANPITVFRKHYLNEYKESGSERYCPSTNEVIRLVNNVLNPRDLAIIVTLFKCGIRRNELCNLNLSNVNMDKMTVMLNPTKKRTNLRVFFDDECAYALRRWIRRRETLNVTNSPALFLTKNSTRMSGAEVDEMFQKYARKAGFTSDRIEEKLTPHCARHWFSNELREDGMPIEYVQWLRGDKGAMAVDRYLHINPEKVKELYDSLIPQFGLDY